MRKPALALLLALAIAGCGSEDEPAKQPSGGGSGSGGGSATGGTNVSMKDIQFQPPSVTVKKGGTVTWTNDDSVGHDVTKDRGPGPTFSSGQPGGMQAGDTFQQKFDTAGTVDYVCKVHPNMKGQVKVR